ncbi:MAG: N-acetylmuramoyl-L-alanine amidase [Lachnospiraceae bacterium]|nr:N-acetylmuramoyl-L-alanine amidase [Lachnospiraceae bacterium]
MKQDQLSILLEEEYFTERRPEGKKRSVDTNSRQNKQSFQRKNQTENRQLKKGNCLAEYRQPAQISRESQRHIQSKRNSLAKENIRNSRTQKRLCRKRRNLFFGAFQYIFFLIVLAFTIFLAAKVKAQLSGSNTSESSGFNSVEAFSSFTESTGIAAGSMTGITIVIDPGHGGDDPGCIVGSVQECDINLSVGLKAAELLEISGAKVILTRTTDEYLSLEERAAAANNADADYFISLHCNYYEDSSSISGLECYYYTGTADGGVLADHILQYIGENTQIEVRKTEEQELSVLRNTTMTAVLIEMGYLSNAQECSKLNTDSYQEELAQAIAEGILFGISES